MGGSDTGDMPSLDAFDHEFGREPVAVLRAQRRKPTLRPLAGLVLAAVIISVPTLAWLSADEHPTSDGQVRPVALHGASREGSQQQVERLQRQVIALKEEIRELTQAQQEATESIAALKAAEQEARAGSAAYWYSDPAALSFGMVGATSTVASAPSRRSATVRPEPREPRRRDAGAPLSLEAPQ